MKFTNLILNLVGLMLFSQHGTAQVEWTNPQLEVDTGAAISVSCTVSGYQNLISSQGTIEFDPAVLSYSHVGDFALTSMYPGSFGEALVGNGRLTFSWSEADLIGKNLVDGDTIFTIHFDVVGNLGDSSLIQLTGDPTAIEFIDASFNPVTFNIVDGKVKINDPTASTIDIGQQNQFKVYPNPAESWIEIDGFMKDGVSEVNWYSTTGELIKNEQIWISGSKGKLITTDLHQGMYLLQIGGESLGFKNRLIQIL